MRPLWICGLAALTSLAPACTARIVDGDEVATEGVPSVAGQEGAGEGEGAEPGSSAAGEGEGGADVPKPPGGWDIPRDDPDPDPGPSVEELCDAPNPSVRASFDVDFAGWPGPLHAELQRREHDVGLIADCVVDRLGTNVDGWQIGLECTGTSGERGRVEVELSNSGDEDSALESGDRVALDFYDYYSEEWAGERRRHLALSIDGEPWVAGVSGTDYDGAAALGSMTVDLDDLACMRQFEDGPAALRFDGDAGTGESAYVVSGHAAYLSHAGHEYRIDVPQAEIGPCCHVGVTYRYLVRALP